MPSQYLHSGEPLPLAPFLEAGSDSANVNELTVFHNKLLDYLRRLTAKLSNDQFEPPPAAGTMAVEALMLTLSSAFTLSGTPDTIIWDEAQRVDTPFTYEVTTGVITLVEAGFYVMFVDLYIPSDVVHTVQLVDGASTVLPYGTGYSDGGAAATIMSESYMIPFAAHVGMTVEFQVVSASGADVEEEGSRLLLLKLGAFTGSGGIDPCDGFDVWQLCP